MDCKRGVYCDIMRKKERIFEMAGFAFIHGELDIKLFLLYVLSKLPNPIDRNELIDICSVDGGVSWFDFTEFLEELVETGHVEKLKDERYMISEEGKKAAETTKTGVPFSVRMKADLEINEVAKRMRRDAAIESSMEEDPQGGTKLRLAFSDSKGEILKLELLSSDEKTAKAMTKYFRKYAEEIYMNIVEMLLTEENEQKKQNKEDKTNADKDT